MAGHRTPLTIKQILAWADAHHERTGNWPATTTGPVHEAPDEGWRAIDEVLRLGFRQLPGGSSLAQVLARQRKVVNRSSRPRLTVKQILAWADAHHKRTGNWPAQRSGPVYEAPNEGWRAIDDGLRRGFRKLPGGSSLAQVLARHRKVVNPKSRPRLTVKQILAWADSHHKRTGRWPVLLSGPVYEAPDERWKTIDSALRHGLRKLPGGLSLAQILARDRKVRNATSKPRLTVKQILAWANAHHERTGKWPEDRSGPVHEAPDETWPALSQALKSGRRGLPSGGSLARLLARHGRKRNRLARPRLSIKQILAWADAHHLRTGKWPTRRSGRVRGERGETWRGIDNAMRAGYRGLPGGQSLPKLLFERRGVRHHLESPPLTVQQILTWADAYYKLEKCWPRAHSGKIPGTGGETWVSINYALTKGNRGMSGDWSLFRFLNRYRHPERGL
ncbi:MAG: hypothetical protein IIA66_14500 [Planctomycetes bacterium]|nr:hypothetical protein [Planctomycetota bacterium]